ncbi:MAG TPA: flagellar export chaperone FlgN [Ruminiclostridium sp.]
MTPEQYIQKLIELSKKKLDGINEILNLTKQQSIIISEDSANELDGLIELKQFQMDMIDELDKSFEVYYARLKSILGVQSIEEIKMKQLQGAAELKQIITTIFDKTKQIQSLEIENKNNVQAIVNKLASDIKRIRQSKMANNGYNVAAKQPRPSYFFDKKK